MDLRLNESHLQFVSEFFHVEKINNFVNVVYTIATRKEWNSWEINKFPSELGEI